MKLHAPTITIFLLAVILAILALIGHFADPVTFLTQYQFWVLLAGFVVLALGCVV